MSKPRADGAQGYLKKGAEFWANDMAVLKYTKKMAAVLFVNIALTLVGVLIFEGFLQVGSLYFTSKDSLTQSPWVASTPNRFIIDPRNGYTGDPSYPEHDDWGFRNERRPALADIVTLGDSWTYGTAVAKEDAWPAILARLSNRNVYNMAMGGTGLINYLQNFHKSLQLMPKIIIVSIYFGNDFVITERHFNMDLADTVFGNSHQEILESIEEAEKTNPLNFDYYHNCAPLVNAPKKEPTLKTETNHVPQKKSYVSQVRGWLSKHSKVYGILKDLKRLVLTKTEKDNTESEFRKMSASLNLDQRRICFPFSDGDWETVFQNAWRARTLNYSDVRIRTGLDVAKKVLKSMSSIANETKAKFLVVLFPTKESVFYNRINEDNVENNTAINDLKKLFYNENNIKAQIIEFLQRENIVYLDMLGNFRRAENQPFFGDSNSHPNAFGNRLIAKAVLQYLHKLRW